VQAAAAGVLAALDSPALRAAVPEHLRDPDGRWYGLSMRVRTMVYNPDRVRPEELSSYAALADARWRGKLCLRSSKKVYNQSLVATQIAHRGVDEVEAMVRGWVANLAAPPFADDTLAIRAVAAGQCEVALVNSYYLGRLQAEDPNIKARLHWADQDGHGVHVNISGAGVVASSKRREAAQRLLEWLAGAEAQAKFAQANYEYPVRAGVDLDPIVAAWGSFKADTINVGEAGRLQAQAVKLMDRSGWR
jgi:iron(III) transport system substrate-binding protein